MQTDKNFLATDPIGPLLRRLAIPTVTAQIINMLYNIVDRIYICSFDRYFYYIFKFST